MYWLGAMFRYRMTLHWFLHCSIVHWSLCCFTAPHVIPNYIIVKMKWYYLFIIIYLCDIYFHYDNSKFLFLRNMMILRLFCSLEGSKKNNMHSFIFSNTLKFCFIRSCFANFSPHSVISDKWSMKRSTISSRWVIILKFWLISVIVSLVFIPIHSLTGFCKLDEFLLQMLFMFHSGCSLPPNLSVSW